MSKKTKKRQENYFCISQNFLTSYETIKRLLRITSINSNDHIIEIGAGKGHITGLLIKACRKVTAVEIDKNLYERLLKKYEDAKNLNLYQKDFLVWRLPCSKEYKVFGNIPFCHTTAILRKLTESENPPVEAWLTMEKGAAKRFIGKPRETYRSLMLKPLFDLKIAYYFHREDFHPKPGVDVVLVHLKKKTKPDIEPSKWCRYDRFISNALQNESLGLRRMFTNKQLKRVFNDTQIYDIRKDEILYVQWLCLFRYYCEYVLRIK